MDNYTLESFINFCDDMQIAEESKFNIKSVIDTILNFIRKLKDMIISFIKKHFGSKNMDKKLYVPNDLFIIYNETRNLSVILDRDKFGKIKKSLDDVKKKYSDPNLSKDDKRVLYTKTIKVSELQSKLDDTIEFLNSAEKFMHEASNKSNSLTNSYNPEREKLEHDISLYKNQIDGCYDLVYIIKEIQYIGMDLGELRGGKYDSINV